MRPEMFSEDLGTGAGGNFHEVQPEINHVPLVDQYKSDIKSDITIAGGIGRLEMMATGAARFEKMYDVKAYDENSILFQQERIKYILDIVKNNPDNAAEKVNESWKRYDKTVEALVSEQKTPAEKQQVKKNFAGIKRSIIGSLGLINFLGEKGYDVEFPEPKTDRFGKCDFFFRMQDKDGQEYNLAVQLKSFMAGGIKKDNELEWEKNLQNAISIDRFAISDKNKADFEKLRFLCDKLQKETGEVYFPVFFSMPVDMERLKPGKGEPKILNLINESGNLQNKNMKGGLDTVWEQRRKKLINWMNGEYGA